MDKTFFIAIGLIILASGCAQKIPSDQAPPSDMVSCDSDGDCVPQPGCHPTVCINSAYADRFDSPEACTMEYRCGAAYSKEDCICKEGSCVNAKDLEGDPSCMA